jgi:hypothetical protein
MEEGIPNQNVTSFAHVMSMVAGHVADPPKSLNRSNYNRNKMDKGPRHCQCKEQPGKAPAASVLRCEYSHLCVVLH